MPTYERELDLIQGYNFKKDVQKPIGFITYLEVGTGGIITADQMVSTPITDRAGPATSTSGDAKAGTLAVVSVLKKIKWDLGDVDPIEFEGTLSVNGKQLCMALLYSTMIDINVNVSFVVYEYDPLAKTYYVAFSNTVSGAGDVKGGMKGVSCLLKKDGDQLKLEVSPNPAGEVQSPENYEFKITVSPTQVMPQQLFLAAANTRRVTKYWGRKGPAF